MKLTIAAKKVGDKWEGALVTDGKFQRALVSDKLDDVVLRGLASILISARPEGTDVLVEAIVEEPGNGPDEAGS
jgi:hypothetical protein